MTFPEEEALLLGPGQGVEGQAGTQVAKLVEKASVWALGHCFYQKILPTEAYG